MTHSPNRRQLLKGGAGAGALVLTGALPRPAPVSGQTMTELASLPLRERIALLFMYPVTGTTLSDEDRAWLQRDKPGGVILLGTHGSYADPVLVGAGAGRGTHVMMDKVVAEKLGGLGERFGAFPVDRAGGPAAADAKLVTNRLLEDGELVHIYPDGGVLRLRATIPEPTLRP